MERDPQLKQWLKEEAPAASEAFTHLVMQRIERADAASPFHQPLVPPRLRRIFIRTVAVLTGLIVLLSLVALPGYPITLGSPVLSDWAPDPVLLQFLAVFWTVFAAHALYHWWAGRRSARSFK